MSSSKLCVCETEDGRFYVRATSRSFSVAGGFFDTFDEAREHQRRCEQDPEYLHWQQYYSLGTIPNPEEETRYMTDMTKTEKLVLDYLFDGYDSDNCVQTFESLSCALSITERQAKTACRRLKRRGLAEHSPYWNEYSGLLGGSGYTLTVAGIHEGRVRQHASKATSETSGSPLTAELAPSQ